MKLLLTSLFCFGLHLCTRPEKLGWKILSRLRLPLWLSKPLYDCPTCMASVYGVAFSFYFQLPPLEAVWFIFQLAAINGILEVLYLAIKAVYEFKKTLIDEGLLEDLIK